MVFIEARETDMTPAKQDWIIGSLYRHAARCSLPRETVEMLLASRAGMKPAAAAQLAGHWFTTEAFRKPASPRT
jgi:hypothetical protein